MRETNDRVQLCLYTTRRKRAWLAHQAALEGRSANAIVNQLLDEYHQACSRFNPETPPIKEAARP
jgi:hypothetical protein